jgi:hypothetical protein
LRRRKSVAKRIDDLDEPNDEAFETREDELWEKLHTPRCTISNADAAIDHFHKVGSSRTSRQRPHRPTIPWPTDERVSVHGALVAHSMPGSKRKLERFSRDSTSPRGWRGCIFTRSRLRRELGLVLGGDGMTAEAALGLVFCRSFSVYLARWDFALIFRGD